MSVATAPLLSGSILDDQIKLEQDAVQEGVVRYRRLAAEAIKRGDGAALKPVERILLYWFKPLVEAIKAEQEECKQGIPGVGRQITGPILQNIEAEKAAVITINQVMTLCMTHPDGLPLTKLAYNVGKAIVAEQAMTRLKAEAPDSLNELDKCYRRLNSSRVNWWANRTLDDHVVNRKACVYSGTHLLWMLIGVAGINRENEDFALAFHHEKRRSKGRTYGWIRMDSRVLDVIEEGHLARQALRPRYMPMLVPPYPWSADAQGGYVSIRTPIVIKPTPDQRDAIAKADMTRLYEGLSAVSSTAWSINRRVLDVVRQVWDAGGNLSGVPMAHPEPLPQKPHDIDTNPDALKQWKRDAHKVYSRNIVAKGDRSSFHRRLRLCEIYEDREHIYYPHQIDYRTRAYPIPQYINHQHDDLSRGLLRLANPVQPGERGMEWIRLHAASCYGHDKLTISQKHVWVKESMPLIARSAADPMGCDWWRLAEMPWRFLATCFALTNPDDAAHLPVEIDGTCNGLQHYAALGRDAATAGMVNLVPSDRPSDIYSAVAATVKAMVSNDAEAGHEIAQKMLPLVNRSLVKQPVMTSVYGVTLIGARKQIQDRLREAGIPKDQTYDYAVYLTDLTMQAISERCISVATIMDWLKDCAKKIVKHGDLVAWTSPMGFPVVQPERKWHRVSIETIMAKVTLRVETKDVPVAGQKHVNGIAPNFVHSIDATHMFNTAIASRNAGIEFAGIHDCFLTHAGSMDVLARVVREEFVRLHEQPLLQNLADEFRQRFPKADIKDPPPPGDWDLNDVLRSEYAFSC